MKDRTDQVSLFIRFAHNRKHIHLPLEMFNHTSQSTETPKRRNDQIKWPFRDQWPLTFLKPCLLCAKNQRLWQRSVRGVVTWSPAVPAHFTPPCPGLRRDGIGQACAGTAGNVPNVVRCSWQRGECRTVRRYPWKQQKALQPLFYLHGRNRKPPQY